MELWLFPLVAYLASSAYLVGWLLLQVRALFLKGRAWGLQRHAAGKLLSLKSMTRDKSSLREILIVLAGMLLGAVIATLLSELLMKEWLLVIFVLLALLSEEFWTTPRETRLLAVMVLFDRLQAQSKPSQDLFESLVTVVQEIPAGEVQKAVRETVFRRRAGSNIEKSLAAFRRLDPLLDEFVLNLRLAGWEKGPALSLILSRLLQRAGRQWDRTSRILLVKEVARPYIQFGRAALHVGLIILLGRSWMNLPAAWLSHSFLVGIGLAGMGLGLSVTLCLSSPWLRRSLVVLILMAALVPYANSVRVRAPAWLYVETITQNPAAAEAAWSIPNPPTPVEPTQAALLQEVSLPEIPFIQPSATPVLYSALPLNPGPPANFMNKEDAVPCCHRFSQAR